MKNIKLLDCTLRDGGRLIDCFFSKKAIENIITNLDNSKIDIIEVGFLRDKIDYKEGSTFFTSVEQINAYIPKNHTSTYVAFTDIGMFDYNTLPICSQSGLTGIRVGFKKGELEQAIEATKIVQEKGYKAFVQGVYSLGYTQEEMVNIINAFNPLNPFSFGIVDTYGSMSLDEMTQLFHLLNDNLSHGIVVDFHSHNNYQMSFSLAQEITALSKNKRTVILDCTLYGMGNAAGNLNTELIVDFLNRKNNYNYDYDKILDLIDEEILPIYRDNFWGYSLPSLLAGVYNSHPKNLIYLTEKFKLNAKDIKNILSSISDAKRKSYDYDNIDKLYNEYCSVSVDDSLAIKNLKEYFQNKNVLVIGSGKTIEEYEGKIQEYIKEKDPIIVNLNFVSVFTKASEKNAFVFFNSKKKYENFKPDLSKHKVILPSNIIASRGDEFVVNYSSLIKRECVHFDNACIMLLRILEKLNIQSVALAGIDGFSTGEDFANNVYVKQTRYKIDAAQTNSDLRLMLNGYYQSNQNNFDISFVTPSQFEDVAMDKLAMKNIKVAIFDVDGTLTDGSICISKDGEIFKNFNVKDGYGIVQLAEKGISPIILTGRQSEIVETRARELKIKKVFQNISDKKTKVEEYLKDNQLTWNEVAYMGDDLNDLECISLAGFSACPADAVKAVKAKATLVCKANGGKGAAREFCDCILEELG